MYRVSYVVAPLHYAKGLSFAIRERNAELLNKVLEEVDVKILVTLIDLRKAMQLKPLMRHTSGRMHPNTMANSLSRLMRAEYITKIKVGHKALYSITTQGRAVVDDINERIIKIIEEERRAIEEGRI